MFIIACDLGKSKDFSAVSVLETQRGVKPGTYSLRSLQRLPLGTAYTNVTEHLRTLTASPALQADGRPPVLVIDGTGVGAAVEDILRAWRLPLISVKIHGGNNVIRKRGEIHVPKKDLVLSLQAAFSGGRLLVSREHLEHQAFLQELQSFKVKINPRTRRATFNGEGAHDDLVLSVALAVYIGEHVL
ncbi:MAG: hypothetical protein RDV48_04600 [Candidatus Eremiobacteraeota bacterium]|nr:hypothetical protein [Candidatus Eremiobacteraeota bacterium]